MDKTNTQQHVPLRQNAEEKRMKHDSGMKDRDDKSNCIEILMTDGFAKIKPTDPFRFRDSINKQREEIEIDPIP